MRKSFAAVLAIIAICTSLSFGSAFAATDSVTEIVEEYIDIIENGMSDSYEVEGRYIADEKIICIRYAMLEMKKSTWNALDADTLAEGKGLFSDAMSVTYDALTKLTDDISLLQIFETEDYVPLSCFYNDEDVSWMLEQDIESE